MLYAILQCGKKSIERIICQPCRSFVGGLVGRIGVVFDDKDHHISAARRSLSAVFDFNAVRLLIYWISRTPGICYQISVFKVYVLYDNITTHRFYEVNNQWLAFVAKAIAKCLEFSFIVHVTNLTLPIYIYIKHMFAKYVPPKIVDRCICIVSMHSCSRHNNNQQPNWPNVGVDRLKSISVVRVYASARLPFAEEPLPWTYIECAMHTIEGWIWIRFLCFCACKQCDVSVCVSVIVNVFSIKHSVKTYPIPPSVSVDTGSFVFFWGGYFSQCVFRFSTHIFIYCYFVLFLFFIFYNTYSLKN